MAAPVFPEAKPAANPANFGDVVIMFAMSQVQVTFIGGPLSLQARSVDAALQVFKAFDPDTRASVVYQRRTYIAPRNEFEKEFFVLVSLPDDEALAQIAKSSGLDDMSLATRPMPLM
ncbi:MAG: hypothetical protein Q7T87_13655 [Polaromonas sp.]|nr:hypothetical protein [Polaromonas sp.]